MKKQFNIEIAYDWFFWFDNLEYYKIQKMKEKYKFQIFEKNFEIKTINSWLEKNIDLYRELKINDSKQYFCKFRFNYKNTEIKCAMIIENQIVKILINDNQNKIIPKKDAIIYYIDNIFPSYISK